MKKIYNKTKFNIELRPSRYFFTLISGLHLMVLLIACISSLPWWILIILLLVIALSYIYLVRKFIYRKSKKVVIKLWQNNDIADPNIWQLGFTDQKIKTARLKPKGYSSDYLIILYFEVIRSNGFLLNLSNIRLFKKLKYQTVPVIVFPDMLDYSCYIALRRFLNGY